MQPIVIEELGLSRMEWQWKNEDESLVSLQSPKQSDTQKANLLMEKISGKYLDSTA
jgi:hypothetical protein